MVLSAAGIPFGAQDTDTGAYMIGDVAVTVVFMESTGATDANTENWTEPVKTRVKQTIEEGLQWWEDAFDLQNSVHDLNFILDYQYADTPVATEYEPITHYSGQFNLWVDDFYDAAQAERTGDIAKDSRLFNNTQRIAHDADWAFTIIVANSENDSNDNGGFFPFTGIRGAFSVAGGSFIVMPSTRPSSTIIHETAHQFWAYDEYSGVTPDYDSTRGYYNTQNTNSFNERPANADAIVDSVMLAGSYMTRAIANHTSSPASFEAIGWRDSDNDGIFDVLDVPLTLSGSGSYDSNSETYRFIAETGVNALPNINSHGNQNDITINRVQEIQYRIDGGAWQFAETVDAYQASVDLTISIANNQVHTIDFRAVDPTGFVTSATFSGTTDQITPSANVGFNGSVYRDINRNGVHDTGEPGLEGWAIEVLDSSSQAVDFTQSVEPDNNIGVIFEAGAVDGIEMSALGSDIDDFFPQVISITSSHHSTGTRVFGNRVDNSWKTVWSASRQLKIEFDSPVAKVSLDAVANSVSDVGRMEAYNSNGNKIARYTTNQLSTGQHEAMVIELDSADIAYVIAWGHSGSQILLDNLQVGHSSTTSTDTLGAFTLPFSETGNYKIKATAPNGQESILIPTGELPATFSGTAKITALNFGVTTNSTEWNNPWDDSDINDDGIVDTNDVDLLLNELQNPQYTQAIGPGNYEFIASHQNGVPYFDSNDDSIFNPTDLLLLMDRLASESQAANSEPELIPVNHVVVHDTLVSSPSTISEFPANPPELELESSLSDTISDSINTVSRINDPTIYLIDPEPMRQTIAAKEVEAPVKLTQKPTFSPALLDTLFATLSQIETNPVTEISKEIDAQETSADLDLIISDDQWIDALFS
ncbi:MAG: hypothetical protein COA78_23715 [Blastopirellula sp.]|nr:MAG: hypothetical protein COA78_23715 [Blastopirellula sp.]